MNKVTLFGRLGGDVEKVTDTVYKFSLATSEKYTNKSGEKVEETQWHRCVAFGKTGETLSKWVDKGSRVIIHGKIKYDSYQNKEDVKIPTTDIIVLGFDFVDFKSEEEKY